MPHKMLEGLLFWHWWLIALAFLVLEMVATAYFFLWLGTSAVVIGVLMLIMEISWHMQWGIWAVLSTVLVVGSYMMRRKNNGESAKETVILNDRGRQYVGRTFTLEEAIINGQGKIRVDDSIWKVECGEDLPAGTKVRATGIDGTVLTVEKAG